MDSIEMHVGAIQEGQVGGRMGRGQGGACLRIAHGSLKNKVFVYSKPQYRPVIITARFASHSCTISACMLRNIPDIFLVTIFTQYFASCWLPLLAV